MSCAEHTPKKSDPVAQWIEHVPYMHAVEGSSPSGVTNTNNWTMDYGAVMEKACKMGYLKKVGNRVYPLKVIPANPDTVLTKGTGWWVKERPSLTILRGAMERLGKLPIVFGYHIGRGDKVAYLTFDDSGWIAMTTDRSKAARFGSLDTADVMYPWALSYKGAKTIFIEPAGPDELFHESSTLYSKTYA